MKPAGYYCHRVILQTLTIERSNKSGAPTEVPQSVTSELFARVTALTATEQDKATGQVAVGDYRVELRFRGDVTEKHQVLWVDENKTLRIHGVLPDRARDELVLNCAEVK